jgi:hypothetical protein
VERAAEQLVLVHRAQRAVVFVRNEIKLARRQPVADPDMADGAALAGQRCADPDRIEHLMRRARHRRSAPVEPRRQRHRGIGGIDDDRGQAVRGQSRAERGANEAATEDKDVCLCHGGHL